MSALSEPVVDLIDACLAGDQPAMRRLVNRFRGQVFGLCYRMLGHREDAEDTAQETFVRVLGSLSRWDRHRPFEPWLLAIAGNRCRTALAKRMRRPTTTPYVEEISDHADQLQAARHLSEEVQLALGGLREQYRQAFRLFHEQQLSYEEIAAVLDCPLGTVKTWVHRARRELVSRLRARGVVEASDHAVPRT